MAAAARGVAYKLPRYQRGSLASQYPRLILREELIALILKRLNADGYRSDPPSGPQLELIKKMRELTGEDFPLEVATRLSDDCCREAVDALPILLALVETQLASVTMRVLNPHGVKGYALWGEEYEQKMTEILSRHYSSEGLRLRPREVFFLVALITGSKTHDPWFNRVSAEFKKVSANNDLIVGYLKTVNSIRDSLFLLRNGLELPPISYEQEPVNAEQLSLGMLGPFQFIDYVRSSVRERVYSEMIGRCKILCDATGKGVSMSDGLAIRLPKQEAYKIKSDTKEYAVECNSLRLEDSDFVFFKLTVVTNTVEVYFEDSKAWVTCGLQSLTGINSIVDIVWWLYKGETTSTTTTPGASAGSSAWSSRAPYLTTPGASAGSLGRPDATVPSRAWSSHSPYLTTSGASAGSVAKQESTSTPLLSSAYVFPVSSGTPASSGASTGISVKSEQKIVASDAEPWSGFWTPLSKLSNLAKTVWRNGSNESASRDQTQAAAQLDQTHAHSSSSSSASASTSASVSSGIQSTPFTPVLIDSGLWNLSGLAWKSRDGSQINRRTPTSLRAYRIASGFILMGLEIATEADAALEMRSAGNDVQITALRDLNDADFLYFLVNPHESQEQSFVFYSGEDAAGVETQPFVLSFGDLHSGSSRLLIEGDVVWPGDEQIEYADKMAEELQKSPREQKYSVTEDQTYDTGGLPVMDAKSDLYPALPSAAATADAKSREFLNQSPDFPAMWKCEPRNWTNVLNPRDVIAPRDILGHVIAYRFAKNTKRLLVGVSPGSGADPETRRNFCLQVRDARVAKIRDKKWNGMGVATFIVEFRDDVTEADLTIYVVHWATSKIYCSTTQTLSLDKVVTSPSSVFEEQWPSQDTIDAISDVPFFAGSIVHPGTWTLRDVPFGMSKSRLMPAEMMAYRLSTSVVLLGVRKDMVMPDEEFERLALYRVSDGMQVEIPPRENATANFLLTNCKEGIDLLSFRLRGTSVRETVASGLVGFDFDFIEEGKPYDKLPGSYKGWPSPTLLSNCKAYLSSSAGQSSQSGASAAVVVASAPSASEIGLAQTPSNAFSLASAVVASAPSAPEIGSAQPPSLLVWNMKSSIFRNAEEKSERPAVLDSLIFYRFNNNNLLVRARKGDATPGEWFKNLLAFRGSDGTLAGRGLDQSPDIMNFVFYGVKDEEKIHFEIINNDGKARLKSIEFWLPKLSSLKDDVRVTAPHWPSDILLSAIKSSASSVVVSSVAQPQYLPLNEMPDSLTLDAKDQQPPKEKEREEDEKEQGELIPYVDPSLSMALIPVPDQRDAKTTSSTQIALVSTDANLEWIPFPKWMATPLVVVRKTQDAVAIRTRLQESSGSVTEAAQATEGDILANPQIRLDLEEDQNTLTVSFSDNLPDKYERSVTTARGFDNKRLHAGQDKRVVKVDLTDKDVNERTFIYRIGEHFVCDIKLGVGTFPETIKDPAFLTSLQDAFLATKTPKEKAPAVLFQSNGKSGIDTRYESLAANGSKVSGTISYASYGMLVVAKLRNYATKAQQLSVSKVTSETMKKATQLASFVARYEQYTKVIHPETFTQSDIEKVAAAWERHPQKETGDRIVLDFLKSLVQVYLAVDSVGRVGKERTRRKFRLLATQMYDLAKMYEKVKRDTPTSAAAASKALAVIETSPVKGVGLRASRDTQKKAVLLF